MCYLRLLRLRSTCTASTSNSVSSLALLTSDPGPQALPSSSPSSVTQLNLLRSWSRLSDHLTSSDQPLSPLGFCRAPGLIGAASQQLLSGFKRLPVCSVQLLPVAPWWCSVSRLVMAWSSSCDSWMTARGGCKWVSKEQPLHVRLPRSLVGWGPNLNGSGLFGGAIRDDMMGCGVLSFEKSKTLQKKQ